MRFPPSVIRKLQFKCFSRFRLGQSSTGHKVPRQLQSTTSNLMANTGGEESDGKQGPEL